jgi:hypothetical protein
VGGVDFGAVDACDLRATLAGNVGARMTTPAGWYPDPSGSGGQRYFDGANWTDRQAVAPMRKRLVWPWIVAGVMLLSFGGCGAGLAVGTHLNAFRGWVAGDAARVTPSTTGS